jgi:hypothetical protein
MTQQISDKRSANIAALRSAGLPNGGAGEPPLMKK